MNYSLSKSSGQETSSDEGLPFDVDQTKRLIAVVAADKLEFPVRGGARGVSFDVKPSQVSGTGRDELKILVGTSNGTYGFDKAEMGTMIQKYIEKASEGTSQNIGVSFTAAVSMIQGDPNFLMLSITGDLGRAESKIMEIVKKPSVLDRALKLRR